jgi:hypothetical protein
MHQASPLRQVVGSVSYRSRFDRGRGSAERRHSPCARDRRAWLRVTSLAKQRGLLSASSTGGSIRAMVLRRVRHPIGRWPIGIQWGRRAHWRALLAITCSPVKAPPLASRVTPIETTIRGGTHTRRAGATHPPVPALSRAGLATAARRLSARSATKPARRRPRLVPAGSGP